MIQGPGQIPMRVGVGIPTQNRRLMLLEAIAAHQRYSALAVELVVVDDGSQDGTKEAVESWFALDGQSKSYVRHDEKRGVAAAKNACLHRLLALGCDHLVLIEDDLRPLRENWLEIITTTAQLSGLQHLLYLPEPMYGVIQKREGTPPADVHWKSLAGGMVMYFTRDLLAACGFFEEKFGRYGYEHNELSSRMLVHLGCFPLHYPHVAELERGKYLWSQDHEYRVKHHEWAPTCLQDGVALSSEQSLYLRQSYGKRNNALYERLMKEHARAWKNCPHRRPARV